MANFQIFYYVNITTMFCSFFVESVQIIPLTILTNGTFVAALSNKSSTEFQNRALLIKSGVSVTCLLMDFGKNAFKKGSQF